MNSESKKPAHRPRELEGGKRVNVYLDSDSLVAAAHLGNGNVSEGIRKALTLATVQPSLSTSAKRSGGKETKRFVAGR